MPAPNSSSSTSAPREGKSRSSQTSSRQKGSLRSTYVFTTRPPSSKGPPTPTSPPPVYPTLFKQPFQDPLECVLFVSIHRKLTALILTHILPLFAFCRVLCHAYNVKKLTIAIKANDDVPERVTMQVLHDTHTTPTHVLAILDTRRAAESKEAQSILYPLIVPIDADAFDKAFNNEIVRHYVRHTPTSPTTPQTMWSESTRTQVITLPTITTRVPHPPSLPLLVLFGQAPYLPLERMCEPTSPPMSPSSAYLTAECTSSLASSIPSPTHHRRTRSTSSNTRPSAHLSTGLLTTYLLPVAVIEEFPAAAAMADVMARTCSDDELAAYVMQNQGLWRNALLLAPQDSAIIEIVRTAWNVTAEARRLKDKMREGSQQQNKNQ